MDKNNQIQNNGNGPKMNMPRFNMNWIYIIAILALGHILRLQDHGESWLCIENRSE